MKSRLATFLLGLALILSGLFLPHGWFEAAPQLASLPSPSISGAVLLQACLVFEGLLLLVLAAINWKFRRLPPESLLRETAFEETSTHEIRVLDKPNDVSEATARKILWGITLLALALRVYQMNSGLWLDEITPIVFYRDTSLLHLFTQYFSTNNHLLNTLLVKASVALLGESEWVARLPAVLFGVATIPLMYWITRPALSRRVGLAAALLLAVSYHHIFFSQNARGYTSYLFFSVAAGSLLSRGLHHDRPRDWTLYVVVVLADFATLLTSGFVLAAHIAVGFLALLLLWRRGASPFPLARRLIGVLGLAGLLGFQLYSVILPQAAVVMKTTYEAQSAGFSSLASGEFLHEVARGLSAGFGPGLLLGALPFLFMMLAGLRVLIKRDWVLSLSLLLPPVIFAAFLTARHLAVSPRFFLLALPLACLTVAQGLETVTLGALRLRNRGQLSDGTSNGTSASARYRVNIVHAVLVLVLSLLSLTSLRRYYATPKQDYRGAVDYLETTRQPDDVAVVIYLAEEGFDYYAQRRGLVRGKDYFRVRTMQAFDKVLATHARNKIFLVTTFPRATRLDLPALQSRIDKEWVSEREFKGTIGDGDIVVWKARSPRRSQAQIHSVKRKVS